MWLNSTLCREINRTRLQEVTVLSQNLKQLVKQLPLSCLLVETDSPVLGPDPQARNEPANLWMAVEAIAGIKQVAPAAVAAAVAENSRRLYGRLDL